MSTYTILVTVTAVSKETHAIAVHTDHVKVSLPDLVKIEEFLEPLQENNVRETALAVTYTQYTIIKSE